MHEFRLGNYLFLVGPGDKPGNIYERIAQSMSNRPFGFVSEQAAKSIVELHGDELTSNGCGHLVGADGQEVWWYSFEKQRLVDNHLSMSEDSRSKFATIADEARDDVWFALELLTDPVQLVKLSVANTKPGAKPLEFRFALARGGEKVTPHSITQALHKQGLKPRGRLAFNLMDALNESGRETAESWQMLEENFGPVAGVYGVCASTQNYFGNSMPVFAPTDLEDWDVMLVYVGTAERLLDPVQGHLIPLA